LGRLEEREPILGIIGVLQFDIVEARLRDEYGVNSRVDRLSYAASRWVQTAPNHGSLILPASVMGTRDRTGRAVLLFPSTWELQYTEREHPTGRFLAIA
jgi:peptide chain release factor 3